MMRNLSIVLLTFASACAGEDGISSLTDIQDEAAGANCAGGGLRVVTGPDDNGNGTLEPSEISVTRYICGNTSTLTSVTPEPAGTNCFAGGVKISTGPDANNNGTLESTEITGNNYVCGAGEAQVVKAFSAAGAGFPANLNAAMTMLSAEITTTSSGELLAIGTVDVYCTPTECPAGNPAASGYLWIADGANMVAPIADFDFFALSPSVTESVTRTARFPIAAAGTHMFNLRGEDVVNAFTFYRPSLTLVFLP